MLKVKRNLTLHPTRSILSVWVFATISFLLLTVFGVVAAQQQPLLTNQSTPSNGSNITDQNTNQSVQLSNSSDDVYNQCLEIAAKSTCDSMFRN
jgi:hypothetical protein